MSIEYKFAFKIYQIEGKQNIEAKMHSHDLLYTLPLKSITTQIQSNVWAL